MTLSFPNQSRSYDADQRRIRFWGYDSAMEVQFFLEEDAILKLYPQTRHSENDILGAFDAGRARIVDVAAQLYAPGRPRSFYVLAASDF